MFRIALHYICPYQVMEISIGDFGAFRDGLEAKRGDSREGDALIKCPSGIRKSQRPFGPSEAAASAEKRRPSMGAALRSGVPKPL